MQIQMQVLVKQRRYRTISLRTRVTQDLDRRQHDRLYVVKSKDLERKPGWAKLKADGASGVINLAWDSNCHMLTARAITRGGNRPHELLAIFVQYLIERHGRRINSIAVQLT